MNKEIRKLSQSFRYAIRGVRLCIRTERNFRIHLCAAGYVTVGAVLGRLDGPSCALLCLCFGLMLAAELLNTAIERLCDRDARGYDSLVRDAKDIAAAAVFVCALFCVAVGGLLFLRGDAPAHLAAFFRDRLWLAALMVLSVPVAGAFIFGYPFRR